MRTYLKLISFILLTTLLAKADESKDIVLPTNLTLLGFKLGTPCAKVLPKLFAMGPTRSLLNSITDTTDQKLMLDNIKSDELQSVALLFSGKPADVEFLGRVNIERIIMKSDEDGNLRSLHIIFQDPIPEEKRRAVAAKCLKEFGTPAFGYNPNGKGNDWFDPKTKFALRFSAKDIQIVIPNAGSLIDYVGSAIPNSTAYNIHNLRMDGIGLGSTLAEVIESTTMQASHWSGFGRTSGPDGSFTRKNILESYHLCKSPEVKEYRGLTFRGYDTKNCDVEILGHPLVNPRYEMIYDPRINDWRVHIGSWEINFPVANLQSVARAMSEVFVPLLGETTGKQHHDLLRWGEPSGLEVSVTLYTDRVIITARDPALAKELEELNKPKPAPDFQRGG